MEHLTKQQIVLLTLLVSFVTSLATGIITVSLVDQAPLGVTQTINRVVEKTIERVVSDSSSTNSNTASVGSTEENYVASAVVKVSKSIVHLKPTNGKQDSVTGLGVVLSANGLILTDKATLILSTESELGKGITAILPSGEEFPIQVVQSEILGDNVFAVILLPKNKKLSSITPVASSTPIKLGDRVFAFSGKQSTTLEEGFIKKIPEKTESHIETSISPKSVTLGSPLFNIYGEVLGYKTSTDLENSSFYSLSSLSSITPVLSR